MKCNLCGYDSDNVQRLALEYARGTLAGKDEEIARLKQLIETARPRPDEDETLQENARLKEENARLRFALDGERQRNERLTAANNAHTRREQQLENLRKGRATAKANAKKRRAARSSGQRQI